ncbi:hypothetical protein CLU79DRAFT_742226 [Phycomyces nitens]|nr:hypothetical protein CLU79DRAFT_742226 [Phycomyces nitens]
MLSSTVFLILFLWFENFWSFWINKSWSIHLINFGHGKVIKLQLETLVKKAITNLTSYVKEKIKRETIGVSIWY